MLQDILTNQQVILAIAFILAAIISILIKKSVDYKKLVPFISFILSLIFKAEETGKTGEIKKAYVVHDINAKMNKESVSYLESKFGSVGNAVEWVFRKFGQAAIKKGINRIFK